MASYQRSAVSCPFFLLLVAFGAVALLVSTQTLTGQSRKEELVYTLTFSGEVTSQPTTAKVTFWPPTTLKVDEPITLDLTAFATSHFPGQEGLSCFGASSPKIVQAFPVEVYEPRIPQIRSETIVIINFIGKNISKTVDVIYNLQLSGSRDCTDFPRQAGKSCTVRLKGWRLAHSIVPELQPGRWRSLTPLTRPLDMIQDACAGGDLQRYEPLRLPSQVTLTASP